MIINLDPQTIKIPERNSLGAIKTTYYKKLITLYTFYNEYYNPKEFKEFIESSSILDSNDEKRHSGGSLVWKHYIDAAKQNLYESDFLVEVGFEKFALHEDIINLIHSSYPMYVGGIVEPEKQIQLDDEEQGELENLLSSDNIEDIRNELRSLSPFDPVECEVSNKKYKKDYKTIVQLKIIRNFECQICKGFIVTRSNRKYVEAAHIIPKAHKGPESPENILILCPNHHKEFDLGDRKILTYSKTEISFMLNGKRHDIDLSI